jgi:hypothetical protein
MYVPFSSIQTAASSSPAARPRLPSRPLARAGLRRRQTRNLRLTRRLVLVLVLGYVSCIQERRGSRRGAH